MHQCYVLLLYIMAHHILQLYQSEWQDKMNIGFLISLSLCYQVFWCRCFCCLTKTFYTEERFYLVTLISHLTTEIFKRDVCIITNIQNDIFLSLAVWHSLQNLLLASSWFAQSPNNLSKYCWPHPHCDVCTHWRALQTTEGTTSGDQNVIYWALFQNIVIHICIIFVGTYIVAYMSYSCFLLDKANGICGVLVWMTKCFRREGNKAISRSCVVLLSRLVLEVIEYIWNKVWQEIICQKKYDWAPLFFLGWGICDRFCPLSGLCNIPSTW